MPSSWKPNFLLIYAGQAVSDFSSMVLQFAIIWTLTDQTGSPMVLSGAMLVSFLPEAVIGLSAGLLIDRYSRKAIMILSDVFISFVSVLLALVYTFGSISVGLVMAVLFLRSVGSAFQRPCLQAITPQIVPKDQLARCAGYSQSIQSVSKLVSPAVAAVLYKVWGLNLFILLDVLGAAAAVATLAFSSIPPVLEGERRPLRLIRDIKEGFRILYGGGMLGIAGIGALYTSALMPVSALFPIICLSYFNGGSTGAGMVEMLFSAGVLTGALILSATGGMKNKVLTIVLAAFLMSVCLLTGGLLPPSGLYIFAAVAFFMGICAPCFWGSQTALLQQSFAEEHMGRVMAITGSIRVIASPVSLSVSGILSERFGAQLWFLVASGLTMLTGLLCLAIPSIRRCDKVYLEDIHSH